MTATANARPHLRIRAFTDGGAGMMTQALGLAKRLADLLGGEAGHDVVGAPGFSRLMLPTLAARLRLCQTPAAAADIVICCGGGAQAAALAMKFWRGAFAVCVQRPRGGGRAFDAIVAPRHDYSARELAATDAAADGSVITTLGSVGAAAAEAISIRRAAAARRFAGFRRPYVAVLLGGDNRAYREDAPSLIEQLGAVAGQSAATLLIVASRRSGAALTAALRRAFGGAHYVWDGGGDNPHGDILAAADGFCVTCDSVNMLSEASATGRAVYWLPMAQKRGWRARRAEGKFSRFRAELAWRGHARPWRGEWEYFSAPPLAETDRAAAAVVALLRKRRPDLLSGESAGG